jgi:hypothetical protein
MNSALMKAILAMDAYNRGYNEGISSLGGLETEIGNFTIIQQSDTAEDSDGVNASFYAIAYEYDGEVVISYRGTDDLVWDPYYGWAVGGGDAETAQSLMAFDFYNAVDGETAYDISLTGHSMGGGLAGLVAVATHKPTCLHP